MSRAQGPLALGGAALVFLVGLLVGFKLLTADADTVDSGPTCKSQTVAKGEKLTSNLVTVNVFNASQRPGLANRVSINLQRRGFLRGTIGNSTSETKPDGIAILTDDRAGPRVKLVAAQFGKDVDYASPDLAADNEGITVIVGDGYEKLVKAADEIKAERAVTVCVPVAEVP